jgi:MFS family permease
VRSTLQTHESRLLEARNVRFLTYDTATFGIVQAGIVSFVAVFLVRLGAPNAVVGFLAAAPALGAIFLSVPAGVRLQGRSDLVRVVTIGRVFLRLPLLAIAIVPFFLTGDAAIWAVVALWTLTSIPAAIVNQAWTGVVAAIIPPKHRARVNGNRWAMYSVVTAIAGAAFGKSLDLIHDPLNFQIVFLISFLAGWATIHLFAQLRMPDSAPDDVPLKPARPVPPKLSEYVGLVREYPPFMRFILTAFVYRIGLNLPVALFSIYWVREAHASNTMIGIQNTAANLMLILSYLVWGRLAARRGHRIVLLLASAGASLYPLATAFVRDEIWLVPVALIWGAFASGIDVSFFEALLRSSPPEHLQTFIGINASLANLVIFIAPIAGSLLADAIGIHAALIAAAVFGLVGTGLFFTFSIAREEATPRDVVVETS